MAKFDDEHIGGMEYGPVRFRLIGEGSDSKELAGLSRVFLGSMKHFMQLSEIPYLRQKKKLKDGTLISTQSILGFNGMPDMDEITIDRSAVESDDEVIGFIVYRGIHDSPAVYASTVYAYPDQFNEQDEILYGVGGEFADLINIGSLVERADEGHVEYIPGISHDAVRRHWTSGNLDGQYIGRKVLYMFGLGMIGGFPDLPGAASPGNVNYDRYANIGMGAFPKISKENGLIIDVTYENNNAFLCVMQGTVNYNFNQDQFGQWAHATSPDETNFTGSDKTINNFSATATVPKNSKWRCSCSVQLMQSSEGLTLVPVNVYFITKNKIIKKEYSEETTSDYKEIKYLEITLNKRVDKCAVIKSYNTPTYV